MPKRDFQDSLDEYLLLKLDERLSEQLGNARITEPRLRKISGILGIKSKILEDYIDYKKYKHNILSPLNINVEEYYSEAFKYYKNLVDRIYKKDPVKWRSYLELITQKMNSNFFL